VKKLAAGLRHNGSHPFVPARSWGAGHGAVPPARPPPPPRTNATAAAAGGGFQLPPTTRPMSRLPAHESQESGPGGGGVGGWTCGVSPGGNASWCCLSRAARGPARGPSSRSWTAWRPTGARRSSTASPAPIAAGRRGGQRETEGDREGGDPETQFSSRTVSEKTTGRATHPSTTRIPRH